jgi:hypothetical protein
VQRLPPRGEPASLSSVTLLAAQVVTATVAACTTEPPSASPPRLRRQTTHYTLRREPLVLLNDAPTDGIVLRSRSAVPHRPPRMPGESAIFRLASPLATASPCSHAKSITTNFVSSRLDSLVDLIFRRTPRFAQLAEGSLMLARRPSDRYRLVSTPRRLYSPVPDAATLSLAYALRARHFVCRYIHRPYPRKSASPKGSSDAP